MMEKEISIPFKIHVNTCQNQECKMVFSIIAHLENDTWLNQMYYYCPYCGAKPKGGG